MGRVYKFIPRSASGALQALASLWAERSRTVTAGTLPPPELPLLTVSDVELDPSGRRVRRAGRLIELTVSEYGVLDLLMRNADIVLERGLIYEHLWGADLHRSSKSLDMHIGALRRKLECHGDRVIHTVRGVGYVMWSSK
jgi:two-component system, OmpR family, response regulator MprA